MAYGRTEELSLNQKYILFTRSNLESKHPRLLLEGRFQQSGFMREMGEANLVMRVFDWIIALTAKQNGWTDEDINQSFDEGRRIARLYKELAGK